jgi:hypothetical protein
MFDIVEHRVSRKQTVARSPNPVRSPPPAAIIVFIGTFTCPNARMPRDISMFDAPQLRYVATLTHRPALLTGTVIRIQMAIDNDTTRGHNCDNE